MKRLFAGMAAVCLTAVLVFPFRVSAVSAQKAIVMDAETGRVLYEKNADERALIASTTKIMTALIVCEQCNVLDRVRIPKEAVGIEGSSMYLKQGEILTVQDLLYGMMLHSGNDAAVALAIYCGGTVEGFAQLMNDKAHRLGMSGSHFENPNGLDAPGHYSTARDMAVLTAYAMQNPIFQKTVSAKRITIGQRCLTNHNKLLWRVAGADGVKTGYTKAAGRILVSSAVQDGRRLVVVTINDPDDWQDHAMLLQNGFSQYTKQDIVHQGDCLGNIEIIGGDSRYAELIADRNFSYALRDGEKVTFKMTGSGFAFAPAVQGQNAGFVYAYIGQTPVGKIPVVFGRTVEMMPQKKVSPWQRLFGGA